MAGKVRRLKIVLLPFVCVMYAVGWILYYFGDKGGAKRAKKAMPPTNKKKRANRCDCPAPSSNSNHFQA